MHLGHQWVMFSAELALLSQKQASFKTKQINHFFQLSIDSSICWTNLHEKSWHFYFVFPLEEVDCCQILLFNLIFFIPVLDL